MKGKKAVHAVRLSGGCESRLRQTLRESGLEVSMSQFIRILLCRGFNDFQKEIKRMPNVDILQFCAPTTYMPPPLPPDTSGKIIQFPGRECTA